MVLSLFYVYILPNAVSLSAAPWGYEIRTYLLLELRNILDIKALPVALWQLMTMNVSESPAMSNLMAPDGHDAERILQELLLVA